MINRILNLIYNELIKQFKKKSVIVIIIFILLLGILLPLSANSVNLDINNDFKTVRIENAEIKINLLKNANTDSEKFQLELAELEKDYWQFMKDNSIAYSSWKNSVLEGYEKNIYKIVILNKILKGIDKKILIENAPIEITPQEIEEYLTLSKEQVNKKLNELVKVNEEKKNFVKNNDYMKYLANLIKEEEQLILENNKEIKKLKDDLKENANDKAIIESLEYTQNKVKLSEKILNIYKYKYNNKIGLEENHWKNKTLIDIRMYEEKLSEPLASEEDFNRGGVSGMQTDRLSYKQYKEIYNKNKVYLQEKIDKDWYSLNNNIPQLEFVEDARTLVYSMYNIFIILTILLIILIGGGIISSEFSKGTIRLLMIRPVVRWKILLSKLLALFIITYGTIIASILILIVTSGAILGFNTLQIGIIEVVKGEIITIPYIQYILTQVLTASTSAIFIISLVFMISTLIRNTALAVSISTILYLISMPATLILGFSDKKWIADTIIPYINQPMLNLVPSFIDMLKIQNGIELNSTWGLIQLIIASIIMLLITFLIFQRKDIKN